MKDKDGNDEAAASRKFNIDADFRDFITTVTINRFLLYLYLFLFLLNSR